MSNDNELKEGDWVRDILTDEVSQLELSMGAIYPLRSNELAILNDGRISITHKHPRFIRCDPPKRKVKKKVYTYVLKDRDSSCASYPASSFNPLKLDSRTKLAEFVNEYEVEE